MVTHRSSNSYISKKDVWMIYRQLLNEGRIKVNGMAWHRMNYLRTGKKENINVKKEK